MNKFCITGIPGVGKSSVVEELNKRGIRSLDLDSMEGLCHWEDVSGKRVEYHSGIGKNWLDVNEYNCDLEKLKSIIDKGEEDVVVAGIVSNQDEFLNLFDKVFLLRCDEETFLHRLDNRENHDFAKDKSEQDHVLGYYREFEDQMLEYGAVPINTGIPLKDVVEKIISEMKNKQEG
jgi:broad-specificity NMP kinase